MADAVRRDTGALNIIETSFILLNASALLLPRVINIEACRMLCHLDDIYARAKAEGTDLTGVKQRVAITRVNSELSCPQDMK